MRKILIAVVILVLIFVIFVSRATTQNEKSIEPWRFQSIDTMKYSRDLSREKLNDPSFDKTIDQQVKEIADTGATHVSIATPYDEEFYPIMIRWVSAARKYHLKVWFRGNFSGWEGWFNYPKITREKHEQMTAAFIMRHQDIFEDGDVFTACPECENGGPGDPRKTGDITGHRKFLIDEYAITKSLFNKMGKNVASNYDSMNGDEAKVIMDKNTTKALDGIVTIDHYVGTPEQFATDIESISTSSGGKIVLGEFGAPIPDLNGNMTEKQQADFIGNLLNKLILSPQVVGISYWTNVGGSTALWKEDGTAKEAVKVIKSFYSAPIVSVKVLDEAGNSVPGSIINLKNNEFKPNSTGEVNVPYFEGFNSVVVIAPGFYSKEGEITSSNIQTIVLVKKDQDLMYKIKKLFHSHF